MGWLLVLLLVHIGGRVIELANLLLGNSIPNLDISEPITHRCQLTIRRERRADDLVGGIPEARHGLSPRIPDR